MTAPVITRRPGLLRLCTVRDGDIVVRTTVVDLAAARDLATHFAKHEGTVPGATEAAAELEIGEEVQITARGGFLLLRSRPTTEDLVVDEGRLVQSHLENVGVDVDGVDVLDDVARFVVDDAPLATRVLEGYGWEVRPSAGGAVWVSAPGMFPAGVEFGCEPGIRC